MDILVAGLLAALALPGAGAPKNPPRRTVLFMPLVARAGASQQLGSSLPALLAASIPEGAAWEASVYDGAAHGMRDPLVAGLARCPDLGCAAELGRRLHFDDVVVGIVEGPVDSRLVMWRVEAAGGSVSGIYEAHLDDATLDRITRETDLVLGPLLGVPGPRPSAAAATAPRPAAPTRADAAPAAAPRRTGTGRARAGGALLPDVLRVAGGVAVGVAVALVASGLVLATTYLGLALQDRVAVRRTGHHVMTRRVALLGDAAMGVVLLGLLTAVPVGAAGAGAIAAAWLMPR